MYEVNVSNCQWMLCLLICDHFISNSFVYLSVMITGYHQGLNKHKRPRAKYCMYAELLLSSICWSDFYSTYVPMLINCVVWKFLLFSLILQTCQNREKKTIGLPRLLRVKLLEMVPAGILFPSPDFPLQILTPWHSDFVLLFSIYLSNCVCLLFFLRVHAASS